MARATVLACDKCGKWDSAENPVRRVTVTGPKFELCEEDRAALLVNLGVPVDVAVEYTRMVNDKIGKTGALPPLSAARELVTERRLSDQGEQGDGNGAVVGLDQPQGDPNGDPDQTDILTALSESSGVQGPKGTGDAVAWQRSKPQTSGFTVNLPTGRLDGSEEPVVVPESSVLTEESTPAAKRPRRVK
jgi:hypothetical protein